MKNIFIIITLLLTTALQSFSQEKQPELYHPEADAKAAVQLAIDKAAVDNKNVLIMIGGNWCRWCRMFDKMVKDNAAVDSALNANFVFEHVNFSKENKNLDLLSQWDFPQRFGFPVFIVLNDRGQRLHTQNSAYLEEGEAYDKKTVIEFFGQWGTAAMDPDLYQEK